MLEAPMLHHGVMEGQGSYNRNSRIQATGMQLSLPLLEKAARNVALDDGHRPVVVADYGSSQGKNSLAPMRIAIRTLQQKHRSGSANPRVSYRSASERFQYVI
jgi:hypothetical protein